MGRRANGPGRDDTGGMIKAIARNVETYKTASVTMITGWHGWKAAGKYYEYQEQGTRGRGGGTLASQRGSGQLARKANKKASRVAGQKNVTGMGVPAANSLGTAIIPVREFLKRELKGLAK